MSSWDTNTIKEFLYLALGTTTYSQATCELLTKTCEWMIDNREFGKYGVERNGVITPMAIAFRFKLKCEQNMTGLLSFIKHMQNMHFFFCKKGTKNGRLLLSEDTMWLQQTARRRQTFQ